LDFGPIALLYTFVTEWSLLFGGQRANQARASREITDQSEMRIVNSSAKKETAAKPERIHKTVKSKAQENKVIETSFPATVLVVDDDPSILRSLRRLVSASGFQVKTFDKPSELLESETPRSNACMVVDINMPEMNGIEMCEVLKRSGRGLPTILITGRTDAMSRSLAAQSDAVAVLFKPFEEEPLLDAIDRALALPTRDRSKI
jgi:CheY-like chemotaxis protein